jgi:hypothetical protein
MPAWQCDTGVAVVLSSCHTVASDAESLCFFVRAAAGLVRVLINAVGHARRL